MFDLIRLMEMEGLEPERTLVVRHVPVEKALKRILPWLVAERPELWMAYQQIQWESLEKAMMKASHIASFIGQDPRSATFAGLYSIGRSQRLDYDGYRSFPGNRELEALGMSQRDPAKGDCHAFELTPIDKFSEWIGRLVVTWPKPYQQWWRWAKRDAFAIHTLYAESRFVRAMPPWQDIVLSWSELRALPAGWRAALEQWRGIYYIWDVTRRAGYVGSASGSENLLGRWRTYANSGHGGNRELRSSNPVDLRFSILQRTSPDLELSDIVALEASWKVRLHTRDAGLNKN